MHDPEFLSALRINAFEVLADRCPINRVQRHIAADAPFDADLWRTTAELGWPMLAVAEAQGGMADGFAALALVQEALGAHCAPLPFTGTVILATALASWHDRDFADGLARQVASGEITGGSSESPIPGSADGGLSVPNDSRWFDSCGSAWTVVEVCDGNDAGLAIVETAKLRLERLPVADRTRTVARACATSLDLPPEQTLLGEEGRKLAEHIRQLALLLFAADAVGGGEALLASTVEFLKTRVQFGKPIGSFQALKHRIADRRSELEMAAALLARARERAEHPDGFTIAAMANAAACKAYAAIAREAVQMHGGIGYTWEHHVHIYLKRATLDQALYGGPEKLLDRLGVSLLEQAA